MLTPFEEKSRLARFLDRAAFRLLALCVCLVLGLAVYGLALPALVSGAALFVAFLSLLALWERATLRKRESALRERVGAALALEELTLMDAVQAAKTCARYLAQISDLSAPVEEGPQGVVCMLDRQRILVRCDLCAPGDATGRGAVLAASRALRQAQADRAVLCTTARFDAHAAQLAEQMEPPVRLVGSGILMRVAGRLSPATDEQLVALGKRKRSPFSWPRLKVHIFSPDKLRRYLLYALALLVLYLLTGRLTYLFPSLMCYVLALLSHRAQRLPFRL